jgi:RNA polymerase sigma factor (sigma-70 family)
LAKDWLETMAMLSAVAQATHRTLLEEVVLAQALESREPVAARTFDQEYMPRVKAVAARMSGPQGLDAIENFAAELIMPREGRPPRIAGYQGRTSLLGWLKAVVANCLVSRARRRDFERGNELDDFADPRPVTANNTTDCEGFLRPVFRQAVDRLSGEDRLLIKLLLIDEVPQKQIACCLGIHSGNITRRHQRITSAIWAHVREANGQTRYQECLESVLAGDDRDLGQTLGATLASALQNTPSRQGKETER